MIYIRSAIILFVLWVLRLPPDIKRGAELLKWVDDAMASSLADDVPVRGRINGRDAQIWVCADGVQHNPIERAAYWQRRALAAERALATRGER